MQARSITQRTNTAGLEGILRPRSVAVIGAGRSETSMSGRLFRNILHGFQGPVYPVNPRVTEICGVRCRASIAEIPEPIDLAVIAVPAANVQELVEQCVRKGVQGLVIISAGFAETGALGQMRQRQLTDTVRAAGIRMVGPNCFGVFNTNPDVQLLATFAAGRPLAGDVGIGAQSGAMGLVIPDYLPRWGAGASTFVSIGNKADVSENDLLEWWRDDPATRVILLYLESFRDAATFRRLAQEITNRKPIVVLKAARTILGERAASSHTAALAAPDRAADAVLRQSGVVRVDTLQEMFEVTALLTSQPLPGGDRVAVLTNAGGPGILCADCLSENGLLLPEASATLQAELRTVLRAEASVRNPVDLIGSIDADEFRRCLELILTSREFDAVVTIYVPREPDTSGSIASAIREVTGTHAAGTTSLAVIMQSTGMPAELEDSTARIPGYDYPESAARALALVRDHARRCHRPAGSLPAFSDIRADVCRGIVNIWRRKQGHAGGWMDAEAVRQLLAAAGLQVPRAQVVRTEDDAAAVAKNWNVRLAVKVQAPQILHKTDVGGVVLDVAGEPAVRDAFRRVTLAVPGASEVLLQEYIAGGQELLIGVNRISGFGHVMVFGRGGVLVELLDDVVCRLHPLTDVDAEEMLTGIRSAALLTGFRGHPPMDVASLRQALLRVSVLISIVPEIVELDLNPILALPDGNGAEVLDGRIRIECSQEEQSGS